MTMFPRSDFALKSGSKVVATALHEAGGHRRLRRDLVAEPSLCSA
jgi:hypothetical protein